MDDKKERLEELFNDKSEDSSLLKVLLISSCLSYDTNQTLEEIDGHLEELKTMVEILENSTDKSDEYYLERCNDGIVILERDKKRMLEENQ